MDISSTGNGKAKETADLLHTTMETLHSEVEKAEKVIQTGFDSMWKEVSTILEQQSNNSQVNMSTKEKEICVLQDQIAKLQKRKCDADDEVVKLWSELSDAKMNQELLSQELQSTRHQHQCAQDEFKSERIRIQKEHEFETNSCKSTIKEQLLTLKEYQNKMKTMTSKLQKLSEQIILEKSTSDKAKKSLSSQLSDQTSEAKKVALEISKMKTDIANSNKALLLAKQNVKKLQLQLKDSKALSEATIMDLQKQQAKDVKTLNEKILSLQHEIEELKRVHHDEIERMKERKNDAERDDFLEARIHFLQHQNRREKVKIHQEKTKHS